VRREFCEAWERARADERFAALELPPADRVHAGYFARRRGAAVDSTGKSREDDEAYALIMADKSRLLSPGEPVRFVFSHSALREGWDNPNVFQICTLRRTRSELKKRQELGRGMRLPVLASGLRTRDPDLARLTVIANESYEAFARDLQREVARDAGVDFSRCIVERRARRVMPLRPDWRDNPWFAELWRRVARPLRFVPALEFAALRERALDALGALAHSPAPRAVSIARGRLEGGVVVGGEVETRPLATGQPEIGPVPEHGAPDCAPVPDPLAWLQAETGLSRATLAELITTSRLAGRLVSAPNALLEAAARSLRALVADESARCGRYEPHGEPLDLEVLLHRPLSGGAHESVAVARSIYQTLPARDAAEGAWLRAVDAEVATRAIFRWPSWLQISSPLGALASGWLVVREGEGGRPELALVVEPTGDASRLSLLAALSRAVGATLELRA
ncbi:MAG: hypothetical protein R3F39_18975, partial [Myxococcota bacterium]